MKRVMKKALAVVVALAMLIPGGVLPVMQAQAAAALGYAPNGLTFYDYNPLATKGTSAVVAATAFTDNAAAATARADAVNTYKAANSDAEPDYVVFEVTKASADVIKRALTAMENGDVMKFKDDGAAETVYPAFVGSFTDGARGEEKIYMAHEDNQYPVVMAANESPNAARSHVVYNGLVWRRSSASNFLSFGAAENVVFANCTISALQRTFLIGGANTKDIAFYNNILVSAYDGNANVFYFNGANTVENLTLEGNFITTHMKSGSATRLIYFEAASKVINLKITGNVFAAKLGQAAIWDNAGLVHGGDTAGADNISITNNIFITQGAAAYNIKSSGGAGGVTVANNIFTRLDDASSTDTLAPAITTGSVRNNLKIAGNNGYSNDAGIAGTNKGYASSHATQMAAIGSAWMSGDPATIFIELDSAAKVTPKAGAIAALNEAQNLVKTTVFDASNNTQMDTVRDSFFRAFGIGRASVTNMAVDKTTLESDGGNVTVTLTGTNLQTDTIASIKVKNGASEFAVSATSETEATATVTLPNNTTGAPVDHTLTVWIDGVQVPSLSKVVTVKKQVTTAAVTGITVDPASLTSAGGTVEATITGEGLDLNPLVVVLNDTTDIPVTVNTGEEESVTVNVTIPANASTTAVATHTLTVKLDGAVVSDVDATVTVAKKAATATVTGASVMRPLVVKGGGTVEVIITGTGLDAAGAVVVKGGTADVNATLVSGSTTEMRAVVTLPANATASNAAHTLTVWADGSDSGVTTSATVLGAANAVTVTQAGSTYQVSGQITGNVAESRLPVLDAFLAMVDGDTLKFHNDVITATKTGGQLTILVYPAAHLNEIRVAMYALMPGDTMIFQPGDFHRVPALSNNAGNNPTNSGTAAKPITFKGADGQARPVFTYNDTDPNDRQNMWEVKGNYINVSHMKFIGGGKGTPSGLRLDGDSAAPVDGRLVTDVSIRDCVFDNIGNTNISGNAVGATYKNIIIEDNEFYNTNYAVMYFGNHEGIYATTNIGTTEEPNFVAAPTRGENIQVRRNFIEGSKMDQGDGGFIGYGIELKVDVTGSVIEENFFVNTKGPGIMVYGTYETGKAQNVVQNNLMVGSRNNEGINVAGGPATVTNNIALGNNTYGITIQNYGGRNLTSNITIQKNTSALTNGARPDYTDESTGGGNNSASDTGRNVEVVNNKFYSSAVAEAMLKRQVITLRSITEKPAGFSDFFTAIKFAQGPYNDQADLIAKLDIMLGGIELADGDFGKDPIRTQDNKEGFIPLAYPVEPNPATGIATLKFKYTSEAGTDDVSGLRLYLGFYGSEATASDVAADANHNDPSITTLPMQIEFTRKNAKVNMTAGNPGAGTSSSSEISGAGMGYDKTVEVKVELNVNTQQYQVTVDGKASGWVPLKPGTYAPLTDIGAVSWTQWNDTGTSIAILGDLPWKDYGEKSYGDDPFDLTQGQNHIEIFDSPLMPVNGMLKYRFRFSPMELSATDYFKLNVFLYGPDKDPTTFGDGLEQQLPMGINFAAAIKNSAYTIGSYILNLNGNESSLAFAWEVGEVYEAEFVLNVETQQYKEIIYNASGAQVADSGWKSLYNNTRVPMDYTAPVNSIGSVAFQQISDNGTNGGGTSRIGSILQSVPTAGTPSAVAVMDPAYDSANPSVAKDAVVTLKMPAGLPATSEVFYTVDGSDPTVYGEASVQKLTADTPITITGNMTIKVVVYDGTLSTPYGTVAEYAYEVKSAVPTASVAPALVGGKAEPNAEITLTASAGADIFYTLDGTTPGTAVGGSTLKYTTAIKVTSDMYVTAIAVEAGLAASVAAVFTYEMMTAAESPVITTQPVSGQVMKDEEEILSVTVAALTQGGTLSYKWYSNTSAATEGAIEISGATSASYTVPTTAEGIVFYYCEVTNTQTGALAAEVISDIVQVTVIKKALEGTVGISGSFSIGGVLTATVSGDNAGGATLHYQWLADGVKVGTDADTYTIVGTDAGKVITCIVTAVGMSGEIIGAASEAVLYHVSCAVDGNVGSDAAVIDVFSGADGDLITITYTLHNETTKANDTVRFVGATGITPNNDDVPGADKTASYTINAADAVGGIIAIRAVFEHSDLIPITDFAFAEATVSHTFTTAGEMLSSFVVTGGTGNTNQISYISGNTAVATVDMNTGVVTVKKPGTTTIYASKSGSPTHGSARASYVLTIVKADAPAAVSVTSVGETAVGKSDGKITGTTAAMEYKLAADSLWIAVAGTEITDLAPGDYEVRLMETEFHFAGLSATVTIAAGAPAFIAVSDIANVPVAGAINVALTLPTAVLPGNATNSTVVWSLKNAAGDVATDKITLTGNTLTVTEAGQVTVTATIANGTAVGTPFTKDYVIVFGTSFIAADDISMVSAATVVAGTALTLAGTVTPAAATDKAIVWTVSSAGTTGATIVGNVLQTTAAGTVVVTATVANGGTPLVRTFNIAVTAPSYTVTYMADGAVHAQQTVSDSAAVGAFPASPTMSGYVFEGWFTAASGGAVFTVSTIITANTTVYAQWSYIGSGFGGGGSTGGSGSTGGTTTPTPPATNEVEITTPDGKVTVNTGSNGDPIKNADGTITLPGESEVKLPNDVEADVPAGSTISPDGTIVVGNGDATISKGDKQIVVPEGSVVKPNGSVTVGSGGGTVINKDGTDTLIPEDMVIMVDEDMPLGFVVVGLSFRDVAKNDWFYDAAKFALENGVMSGTSIAPPEFSPSATTTRAMIVTMLYRLSGAGNVSGSQSFTDVAGGSWYEDAVIWASSNNIVFGVGNNKFDPNAPITRQDLAVVIQRYANYAGLTLPVSRDSNSFADENMMGSYAKDAIQALYQSEVINGKLNNVYDPQGKATRGEVATLLMNFINNVVNQ